MTTPAPKVAPGGELDCFALFGLPRGFAVELGDLEARYLERSREVHPDRVAGRGADERLRATGRAMDLNRAYRVLKRPVSRAEHLLALEGVRIGDNEPVAPALLAEVLELREALDEARARGDRAELDRLERVMRERERAELDRVAAALARSQVEAGGARQAALEAAKAGCLALRYIARYLEAVAAEDEG